MLSKILGWLFKINFDGWMIDVEPMLAYVWRVKLDGSVEKFLALTYIGKPNPTYKPLEPPVHVNCRCRIGSSCVVSDYKMRLEGELAFKGMPNELGRYINGS